MKIPRSIRALYAEQKDGFDELKQRVDSLLRPRLLVGWHYESRVKTEESFTLKLETGRVKDVSAMDDFFAATIVVRNSTEIGDAEALVNEVFDFSTRRPAADDETHKAPDQFPFDDLRINVRWKDDPALPPRGLNGKLFEIQIKTFLQHAWSIATHDLTYKTDVASWGKMRIAYQIKAMLEHAELSIQEATTLSTSASLNKTDAKTAAVAEFIGLVTDLWPKDELPSDIRRLAENLIMLSKITRLDGQAIRALLIDEQAEGRGPLTRNLTPFGIVVQTLLTREKTALLEGLKHQASLQPKYRQWPILLTSELELPPEAETAAWKKTTLFISDARPEPTPTPPVVSYSAATETRS